MKALGVTAGRGDLERNAYINFVSVCLSVQQLDISTTTDEISLRFGMIIQGESKVNPSLI